VPIGLSCRGSRRIRIRGRRNSTLEPGSFRGLRGGYRNLFPTHAKHIRSYAPAVVVAAKQIRYVDPGLGVAGVPRVNLAYGTGREHAGKQYRDEQASPDRSRTARPTV